MYVFSHICYSIRYVRIYVCTYVRMHIYRNVQIASFVYVLHKDTVYGCTQMAMKVCTFVYGMNVKIYVRTYVRIS